MPCLSLFASKVAPLGNGVQWEYLDSMVQLIRNGGASPSCTSKVLTSGIVLVERQYASKVSCSQFVGTPLLLSAVTARVTESRTLICIMLLRDAALANIANSKKTASRTAILRILIGPTPPNTADACVAYPVFPNDSGSRSRRFGTFSSPGAPRTIAFPVGGGFGGQTRLPAAGRVESVLFFDSQCRNLRWPFSVMRPANPSRPVWARWGGGSV